MLRAWERLAAQKESERKRLKGEEEDRFFSWEPKPNPPVQTAVRNASFPPPQSRPPTVKPAAVETPVEEASRNEKPVPQERPPEKLVQLALPMGEGKKKPGAVKEEEKERPETKRERKRRPGRPGAGRRRWRR